MDMKKITIFLLLVFLGITFSFLCFSETNSTSILVYHERNVYASHISGPIVAGQKVHGEFQAAYDNLGMVKLRIHTYNRINTTHIMFVLREKGKPTPSATNTYATDRFPDRLLYPFGFPVITDSKGKTYEFTVESLDGTPDNAIGIDSGYHDVATQYVLGRSEIRSHVSEKIKSILLDPYSVLYITMFLVPAVVFFLKRYEQAAIVYMMVIYSYLPVSMHSNTILVVAASILGIALFMRTPASRIYAAALLWLLQIPVMVASGAALFADRDATLVFFLMLIGGIISIL